MGTNWIAIASATVERTIVLGLGVRILVLSLELHAAQEILKLSVASQRVKTWICSNINPRGVEVHHDRERIEASGNVRMSDRLLGPAHRGEIVAVPHVRIRIIWIQVEGSLELPVCGCPVPIEEQMNRAKGGVRF